MKISVFPILRKFINKKINWKDIEYFDDKWKLRIDKMSKYIERNDSVMDLGCGKMWLKKHLHETNLYIPVDYKNRGEGTIICEFNKNEFP